MQLHHELGASLLHTIGSIATIRNAASVLGSIYIVAMFSILGYIMARLLNDIFLAHKEANPKAAMKLPNKASVLCALLATAGVLGVAAAKDPNPVDSMIYILSGTFSVAVFAWIFQLAEDVSTRRRKDGQ